MGQKTEPLFNPNDGVTGRDGGPYLDEQEAYHAETRRAKAEDRKPDYDNCGVTAGIPLQNAREQLKTVGVNNIPSQTETDSAGMIFDAAVKDPNILLQSRGERPVLETEGALAANPQQTDESGAPLKNENKGPDVGDDLQAASKSGALSKSSVDEKGADKANSESKSSVDEKGADKSDKANSESKSSGSTPRKTASPSK